MYDPRVLIANNALFIIVANITKGYLSNNPEALTPMLCFMYGSNNGETIDKLSCMFWPH